MIAELQRARLRYGPCGLLCDAIGHVLVDCEDGVRCRRCALPPEAIVALNAKDRHRPKAKRRELAAL